MRYIIILVMGACLMLAGIHLVKLQETIRYQQVYIDQLQDTVVDLEEGR